MSHSLHIGVDNVDNAVICEKSAPARDCWRSVDNERKKLGTSSALPRHSPRGVTVSTDAAKQRTLLNLGCFDTFSGEILNKTAY